MGDLRRPNKNRFWNTPLIVITIIAVIVGIWASYSVGYRRGIEENIAANRTSVVYSVTTEKSVDSLISEVRELRGVETSQETASKLDELKARVKAQRETKSQDETEVTPANPVLKQTETVYWVSNGKVWHTDAGAVV